MLKWYHFISKYGTISIKARWQSEALREAAYRWRCDISEIVCTGWDPYRR